MRTGPHSVFTEANHRVDHGATRRGVPRRGNLHSLARPWSGPEIGYVRRVPALDAVLDWLAWFAVPFIMITVCFGLPIALIVYLVRKRRRTDRDQQLFLVQLGWVWVPPNPWLVAVAEEVFARGRPVAMAAGPYQGRDACVLDFQYTQSTGERVQTVECHLVAVNLPVALPPLVLSGQNRLVQLLAGRDLELENQAFNDRFRIDCYDDRYASAVLHPRVMELMLANDWLDWRINGNALVSWAYGRWTPADVVPRLEVLTHLAALIPNFVLRDYGSQ